MNENLTVAELKEKKDQLESAIVDLIRNFEDETGFLVERFNAEREASADGTEKLTAIETDIRFIGRG